MTTESNTSLLATLSDNLSHAVVTAGASIVTVDARRHIAASGVLWSAGGIVVTADHVVERDDAITIGQPDGSTATATIVGRDSGTDLVVLRISGDAAATLPAARITPSAQLKIGHIVLALGRPGGVGLAASMGVIGSLEGQWRTPRGGVVDALICADVTLYPGFSGGPLVNTSGEIVGINTSGLARGMGLTIPTETINRVVSALLTRGRLSRGYLGVGMQPVALSESLRARAQLTQTAGLMLVNVEAGGPADQAGLLLGDILIALDHKELQDTSQVQSFLDPDKVGQAMTVRLIRGGAIQTLALTIGERP